MPSQDQKVTIASFHRAVRSATGEPEYAFYKHQKDATKKSRVADMTYTRDGLVCKQGEVVTIVPLANVVYVRLE